jgi:hypothetical protein
VCALVSEQIMNQPTNHSTSLTTHISSPYPPPGREHTWRGKLTVDG